MGNGIVGINARLPTVRRGSSLFCSQKKDTSQKWLVSFGFEIEFFVEAIQTDGISG